MLTIIQLIKHRFLPDSIELEAVGVWCTLDPTVSLRFGGIEEGPHANLIGK